MKVLEKPFAKDLIAIFLVLLLGVWSLLPAYQHSMWQIGKNPDIMTDPVDAMLIVTGLEKAPSFTQTLSWWVGPWAGTVPFYRPLTSMFWWTEYQLFGRQGLYAFQAIHLISHLLFLLVLYGFMKYLTGRKVALLSIAVFTLYLSGLIGLPTGLAATMYWKDDPDLWVSTAFIGAMWAFARYLREENEKYYKISIVLFFVGILFKEMVYTLPFALIALLWHEKRLALYKKMVPFFVIAAIMFAFRTYALQGYGFRFGSNNSWFPRWLQNTIGGTSVAMTYKEQFLHLTVAFFVLALVALLAKRWKLLGVFSVLSVLAFGIEVSFKKEPALDVFWTIFTTPPWASIPTTVIAGMISLVMIGFAWRFLSNRPRLQILSYLMVLVTYLPLMTAPITDHALYLVSVWWSLWLAIALVDFGKLVQEQVPKLTIK